MRSNGRFSSDLVVSPQFASHGGTLVWVLAVAALARRRPSAQHLESIDGTFKMLLITATVGRQKPGTHDNSETEVSLICNTGQLESWSPQPSKFKMRSNQSLFCY